MTETAYCYCCRAHHPKTQMRLFRTKAGHRWRCIKSIEAATRSCQERDAFGQQQTEQNRAEASAMAERRALLRLQVGTEA